MWKRRCSGFKGALDETIKATEKLAEDLATRVGEKKRKSCRDI